MPEPRFYPRILAHIYTNLKADEPSNNDEKHNNINITGSTNFHIYTSRPRSSLDKLVVLDGAGTGALDVQSCNAADISEANVAFTDFSQ